MKLWIKKESNNQANKTNNKNNTHTEDRPLVQLSTISVRERSTLYWCPPLYSYHTITLPPLWPPRPLESKVIQIQSDHLLAASPPVAAMERSKVTCSVQVCWRKLGPHQKGLLWPSCWLGSHFFLILDVALLNKQSPHLRDRQVTMVLEESLVSFFSSTHWAPLTVSLASHPLDNFSTVVWRVLATCWRRTSERTLSVGSLHVFVFCFTRFYKVLGWSSCLALSNQQACVRPCCFTGRPRPLGTGFFNGSMVLSFDLLLLPPLRFLTHGFLATGSPRLTASLSFSVTGKAPC